MDIIWLQDFLALAETRHFTQAASRRNISQAAFSRRIRALEAWLGVTLIERGTVPAHLTAVGKQFEREARETVSRLLDARASLTGFTSESSSRVRVSVTQSISEARLALWWANWRDDLNINLETHISRESDIVAEFLAGYSDLLICHQSNLVPQLFDSRHYVSTVIETDRLVPVVANDSAFHANASFNALKSVPLLMYSSKEYFSQVVSGILEKTRTQLLGELVIETDMANFVASCAAKKMGMGWIPESLLRPTYNDKLLVLEQPSLCADMSIVAYVPRKKRSFACDQIWKKMNVIDQAHTR